MRGIEKFHRPMNFTDTVSLISIICRYDIVQLIIKLHYTTM